jgi:PadR family transcriptional regulator, regulatory protein PadR
MVVAEVNDQRDAHLLRGVLDMCVLAVLSIEPTHAYDVAERLRVRGFSAVGYGTIYPLVTRLRRQGLLEKQALPSPTGPMRNVLTLTEGGRQTLAEWRGRWERTTATASDIMSELDRTQARRG